MSETTTDTAQAQTPAPQVQKGKTKHSGNAILDMASEIEGLTKPKALNLADKLVDNLDSESFRLGGVLKVILDNAWHEGYESFGAFCMAKYGFKERKARYLIEIYENLVQKMIPWEKVAPLGWTKLKDLARFLTQENVDEWVAKALPLTVAELQALLSQQAGEGGGEAKTTSDTTTVKFKFKGDQLSTVQSALSKAKAETQTEFDNVALEMICAGYLGGTVYAAKMPSLEEQMKTLGWQKTLEIFDKLYTDVVDLVVTEKQ